MNSGTVIFDPYLPWAVLGALGVLMAALLLFAGARGLLGAWVRGLATAALLLALANPSLQEEDRSPLTDIVLVVVDETASQRISDRTEQTEAALEALSAEITARTNTELRVVRVGDGPGNAGTLLVAAMTEALSEIPQARLAGTILLSDGQVHDLGPMPNLPAPLHLLLTGREGDWDRQIGRAHV